jgi:transposase
MSAHILKNHHSVDELLTFKNKSKDEGEKLRLRAIINLKKGKGVEQVGEELLISRRSISTWVKKYNDKGLGALKTNLGGRSEGNPKWDITIFDKLTEMIKTNGGYWSIPKMQDWIKENYAKLIPEQTVWYHLDKLGFSYKSSRPHPYKGNKTKQESFKKRASQKSWHS